MGRRGIQNESIVVHLDGDAWCGAGGKKVSKKVSSFQSGLACAGAGLNRQCEESGYVRMYVAQANPTTKLRLECPPAS